MGIKVAYLAYSIGTFKHSSGVSVKYFDEPRNRI